MSNNGLHQRCVNGNWLCQWERAIFDPRRIHIPWPITKNLLLVITLATPTAVPNLVQIRQQGGRGGFCANGWNITKILFICAFFYFMMAQTMWTCARMCLLGVSLILLPILGVIHAWRNHLDLCKNVPFGGFVSKNRFNILCNYTMTLHNFDTKTANINTKNCSLSHRLVSDWLKMNMCV